MIKVKKDWWKGFFDETYLITDARSVMNDSLTHKETTLIEKCLRLEKFDAILDLCGGQGRHALELAKRGYENVTVLDYSPYLTRLGKESARDAGLRIKFVTRDARSTRLKDTSYKAVYIMANSFGYFSDDTDNIAVLREASRLLNKDGTLLLDLIDPYHVRNTLKPFSWHEANDDIVVCRERELEKDTVRARELVISKKKGLLREGMYCTRIYDKSIIKRLLRTAGFRKISIMNKLSLHDLVKDYGLLTSRMVVTARKN